MAIRDIIIVGIVIALALWSLRKPWIGVMNWTWLSIMNPHRYAWGFAYSFPVAAIAGIATLIGLLLTKERQSPFKGAPTWWLIALATWITLSWLFGYDAAGDFAQWDKVMKIYLMTFVALSLLHTKQHIIIYAWVTVGSVAFLAAKGGFFTIVTGGSYRVWGPLGSFISDNNHFALAAIMTSPMLHFLQLQLKKPWQRHLMTLTMLLSIAAALGSPVNCVAWLANTLGRFGIGLKAGEVILSGALVPLESVAAGDFMSVSIGGIGSASVRFT